MKKILLNYAFFLTFLSIGPALAADVQPYATLLSHIAAPDGVRFDRAGEAEKKLLSTYLTEIALDGASTGTREEQLAFWINAHNVCVMKYILDRWPVEDVMKISGLRDRLKCKVAGQERTLVEMVSGVIRPLYEEPRIHFALWWGTRGGPRLRTTPYDGKGLSAQLEDQMKESLARKDFVEVQTSPKQVVVSPILDWFKRDFGNSPAGVLQFLKKTLPAEQSAKLPKSASLMKFANFDWSVDASKS